MSITLQLIFLILSNSVELDYLPLLFPFICSIYYRSEQLVRLFKWSLANV